MTLIDKAWKIVKGKGRVKNLSSKTLFIVENDTQNRPVARKLGPKRKTPRNIDADGFKRIDGKPIKGHDSRWKLRGWTTIEVEDDGDSVKFADTYGRKHLKKVKEMHFGKIHHCDIQDWGIPIRDITRVRKGENKNLEMFFVEDIGWKTKNEVMEMIEKDEIENAVVV
ncbi:MAG: hypothetical protein GY866_37975 [Proteobacteria bacterium]|nr:hypothetical protein [Pseudomonadota bacterium]